MGTTEIILNVIVLGLVALWVYPLIEIIRNKYQGDKKTVWLIVVLVFGSIGGVIYLFIGRKHKLSKDKF